MEQLSVPFNTFRLPFVVTGSFIFVRFSRIILYQKGKIALKLFDKLAEVKFKLKLYIMSNLINIYIAGGVEYMHPITLLFLFNLGVVIYVILNHVKKKSIDEKWIETIKHVGGLALAVGTIGTLVGLFFAFDALEASKDVIPFPVIMGGLKVALINILYGLFIFFISMMVYVAMKLKIHGKSVTS